MKDKTPSFPKEREASDEANNAPADRGRRRLLTMSGLGGASLLLRTPNAEADATNSIRKRLSLHTRLTQEYGVTYPFVGAGMGFVSMPALVAAVTNAGGIGVLGAGIEPPPGLQALIRMTKATTTGLFGVDFLYDNAGATPITTDEHIDICIAEGVRLVVFHMNVPPKAWVDRLHASGAKVWMQAASVAQAVEAVGIGIDLIIAQGSQAGGHNKSTTRTLKLVKRIIDAVHPTLVLASGGIADGAAVVNALAQGADGVWVGTRLVASHEAYAHPEYKRRIVEASGNATATMTAFGPEYPNRPYRLLRNRVVKQWEGREDNIPTPPPPPATIGTTMLFPLTLRVPYTMPKFSALIPGPETVGDFDEMSLPAGEDSVKSIKRIQPAAEIVLEMMGEARRMMRELGD